MTDIVESGITVKVAGDESFRLQDSPTYQRLSGLNLKEMDVGWWEPSQGVLVLMELKGEGLWEEGGPERRSWRLDSLERKANDTLLILGSVWSETRTGLGFAEQMPPEARAFPGENNLRLVFVIDTPESRREFLPVVKEELNARLAGRLRLFDVRRVAVMDVDSAASRGFPVSRAG